MLERLRHLEDEMPSLVRCLLYKCHILRGFSPSHCRHRGYRMMAGLLWVNEQIYVVTDARETLSRANIEATMVTTRELYCILWSSETNDTSKTRALRATVIVTTIIDIFPCRMPLISHAMLTCPVQDMWSVNTKTESETSETKGIHSELWCLLQVKR